MRWLVCITLIISVFVLVKKQQKRTANDAQLASIDSAVLWMKQYIKPNSEISCWVDSNHLYQYYAYRYRLVPTLVTANDPRMDTLLMIVVHDERPNKIIARVTADTFARYYNTFADIYLLRKH